MIEVTLREKDDVINVDDDILKCGKDVRHVGLKDITGWH